MDENLEKAFATLENVMNKKIQEFENNDQSVVEIQKSIDENAEMFSRLNQITGNQESELENCIRLLKILPQIKSIDKLPAQEEIQSCIRYLIQENNMLMLGAVCSNMAGAYQAIQKNSEISRDNKVSYEFPASQIPFSLPSPSRYNKIIYEYYCLGVEATVAAINLLEKEKSDKRILKNVKTGFAYLLVEISIFLNETKQDMDVEYVKIGCQYAIENDEIHVAKAIANNFTRLYNAIESEQKKVLEVVRILMEINKKIIDKGLDHDLELCIKDAQTYSNTYQYDWGIGNEEKSRGFWYAAYYAEHSKKESRRYRNYECAVNNYWYSKFAREPIDSEFWEKAYRYAKKFPTDQTCSMIVKEYRELKKIGFK